MKTNNLIILLVFVFIGGVVALVLWLKNNASRILADTATKTLDNVSNSDISLKERLRNTAGYVLDSQVDTLADTLAEKTRGTLRRWFKL